jgi:hypothetical protein
MKVLSQHSPGSSLPTDEPNKKSQFESWCLSKAWTMYFQIQIRLTGNEQFAEYYYAITVF